MALAKTSAVDKITIRAPYNHLELRTATIVGEDGKEIAHGYTHSLVKAGTLDSSDNLVDTDMSGYSTEIQGVAAAVWTDAVKAALKASLIAEKG